MKKLFLFTLSVTLSIGITAQIKNTRRNISISIPVIQNESVATYYTLGKPQYPIGNSISYGINLSYSLSIYSGIYGKIGLGYFRQNFKIIRPFNFYNGPWRVDIIYYTESYFYNNAQLSAGMGYVKEINNYIRLTGFFSYNYFYSFRQRYILYKPLKSWETNYKDMPLGSMINIELGIQRKILEKISVGIGVIIPVYTHWNKDEIFYNLHYSNDEQQIARSKYATGIAFSWFYYF